MWQDKIDSKSSGFYYLRPKYFIQSKYLKSVNYEEKPVNHFLSDVNDIWFNKYTRQINLSNNYLLICAA